MYMPQAEALKEYIKRKRNKYKITDIPAIDIPESVLEHARKVAPKLGGENRGQKTMDGGVFKDIKGVLGQWAVHKYLSNSGWLHTYSEPYIEKQYGDQYDILFAGYERWDVKCRDWWKPEYFYNIRLLMGEHEYAKFEHEKHCDYYIFTTVAKDYSQAFILGGIGGHDLWNKLTDLSEDEKQYMKYPTKGKIYSRFLTPIRNLILKTRN